MGWPATLGVAWLTLLLAPRLPYRRPWAGAAVPGAALASLLVFAITARFAPQIMFYLGLPMITGLMSLSLGVVHLSTARLRPDSGAAA